MSSMIPIVRRDRKTARAASFRSAVMARLNAGATAHEAVVGAIREQGPLRTVRVSSAQARGAAKAYAYWGAVRYAVCVQANGNLANIALERASSDRRSESLAEKDADEMADSEDRVWLGSIGGVSAKSVLAALGIDFEG